MYLCEQIISPTQLQFLPTSNHSDTPPKTPTARLQTTLYTICVGTSMTISEANGLNSHSLSNGSLLINLHIWNGFRGLGRGICNLSYPNLILTCPRCTPLLQTRLCEPRHGGIPVSFNIEKMPEYNQAVWKRKGSNPTIRLTFRQTSNLSWGKFEYLQVSNTTAGKI